MDATSTPPDLPAGVVHHIMGSTAYTDLIYLPDSNAKGHYVVRWNDGKWYYSAQETPRDRPAPEWGNKKAPVPEWYIGPFDSYQEPLASLILSITE